MKKFLSFLAISIAVICFVQTANAQPSASTSINLKMTVAKYIETMPNPAELFLGTTTHSGNAEILDGGFRGWNLAYANCPFNLTLSGSNPAGQNVPRFARAEVGANAGGRFDVLNTFYQIHFVTNGVEVNTNTPDQWGTGASQFPLTKEFSEAPHNGQVYMSLIPYVNDASQKDAWPQRQTLINSGFTADNSADAGDYTCTFTVTLTAI